jgi:sec-independent protein translocase protein TatA
MTSTLAPPTAGFQPYLALFNMPHGVELIIILLVILLLFGNRLPNMARNIGRSLTEFKKGIKGPPEETKEIGKSEDSSRLESSEKKPDRETARP